MNNKIILLLALSFLSLPTIAASIEIHKTSADTFIDVLNLTAVDAKITLSSGKIFSLGFNTGKLIPCTISNGTTIFFQQQETQLYVENVICGYTYAIKDNP